MAKFTVEIELDYPGIDDESLDMVQQNISTILERGATSITEENEDVEVTCTGNIIKKNKKHGILYYYVKVKVPETYEDPSLSQFEDFMAIPTLDPEKDKGPEITYEQFCKMSKGAWKEAQENGYGLGVHSKFAEYADDVELEKIKEGVRNDDGTGFHEGFIGFPEDDIIDTLITPMSTMIKRWQ